MKVAVVTFPGSNCDQDCYRAVELVGGTVEYRWHREPDLGGADAVVLPGGFSYGDYLRPGAIARMSPVMESVVAFARSGGPVLGICNGFQILCEAGLLPGALLRNESLKFQSQDCWLRVDNAETLFTSAYEKGQVLRMPLAHADGNYHADEETLARLEGEGRIVFRYATPDGEVTPASNPNGSAHNIAGIVSEGGNVMAMMPHPDRAMEGVLGSTDGRGVFDSLVEAVASREGGGTGAATSGATAEPGARREAGTTREAGATREASATRGAGAAAAAEEDTEATGDTSDTSAAGAGTG